MAFNTAPNYNFDVPLPTREKNPLEKIMAKIVDLDREIDKDVDALVDFKAEVWERLDELECEKHKKILWIHYAERKSWTKISDELKRSRRHVIRLHKIALENLEKILKN